MSCAWFDMPIQPAVSIIVPIFNAAPYLRRCLDSLCRQSLEAVEIICVNDASTDDSGDILREYAAHDHRVHPLFLPKNCGPAAARNAGLAVARGEFVGFVDSDDYVEQDYYETLYNAATQNRTDIAKAVFSSNSAESRQREIRYNEEISQNKYAFSIHFTTAIYANRMLKKNRIYFLEKSRNFEDIYFLIQCVYHANSVSTVDSTCYHYSDRASSASRQITLENINHMLISCAEIIKALNSYEMDDECYNTVYFRPVSIILWFSEKFPIIPRNIAERIVLVICQHRDIIKFHEHKLVAQEHTFFLIRSFFLEKTRLAYKINDVVNFFIAYLCLSHAIIYTNEFTDKLFEYATTTNAGLCTIFLADNEAIARTFWQSSVSHKPQFACIALDDSAILCATGATFSAAAIADREKILGLSPDRLRCALHALDAKQFVCIDVDPAVERVCASAGVSWRVVRLHSTTKSKKRQKNHIVAQLRQHLPKEWFNR